MKEILQIREANENDYAFVVELMCVALAPYYGGDHARHAERIFRTHISGGSDNLGFFSTLQKMFIAEINEQPSGMLHVVCKRQATMKISPLIVHPEFQKKYGIGSALLEKAEQFSRDYQCRQIYCTVAKQNDEALAFFLKKKYTITGNSDSHYKSGVTELMLYKPLGDEEYETKFDRDHISVLPFSNRYADQVRILLLDELPKTFLGINDDWVDGLFNGYERRDTNDVNAKYKLIYLAIDRDDQVRGVLGATPKKGSPIKLMPFIARDLPSFVALLKDIPFSLREYGHKLYIHTAPTPDQVIALQQNGWLLNGAMPAAYHPEVVTQQWSLDVDENKTMRTMRVKERFLKYIEEGTKDLEVRVAYTAIKSIRIDELIEFTSRTRNVMVRVTDIRNYGSFDEMLTFESPDRIVPGESRMSLLKILRDIYPLHKERLGVVVIQITFVNSD